MFAIKLTGDGNIPSFVQAIAERLQRFVEAYRSADEEVASAVGEQLGLEQRTLTSDGVNFPTTSTGDHWLGLAFAIIAVRLDEMPEGADIEIVGPRARPEELVDDCPLCAMLRSDGPFASQLVQWLDGAETVETVDTAAWYLGNMVDPTPDIAVALIDVSAKVESEQAGRALEDLLARRREISAGLGPLLEARRQHADGDLRAVALVALTKLGVTEPPIGDELCAALADDLHGEARHDVILALINLYMHTTEVPAQAIAALEAQAARTDLPAQVIGLARWGVEAISGPRPWLHRS